MKQKQIILLPFPFSDLSTSKVRPALVVSNDDYNSHSKDVLAVPLTSVLRAMPYSVVVKQKDLSKGKLLKTSRVKIDKVFSVEKNKVMMAVGELRNCVFERIRKEVLSLF